jgi:hypothetical protein
MTSVVYATKGRKLGFAVQANPYTGTISGIKQIRTEGAPDVKAALPVGVTPETVFGDANDNEYPVLFDQAQSGCIKFKTAIRNATVAGAEPSIVSLMRAGGYTVATPSNDTTLASYTSVTQYTMTDASAADSGEFRAITLSDGRIFPVLITVDGSGAAITPHYALPAASATSAVVRKCWTITPGQPAPLPADKYLTMCSVDRSYATDSGNEVAVMGFVESVGDLVYEPGKIPTLEFTVGAGEFRHRTSVLNGLDMTTADSFADSAGVRVANGAICYITASSAAGSIAAAYQKITKATFKPGLTAKAVEGQGDAECLGGIQGAATVAAPGELTLEMMMDTATYTQWSEGQNADKMVAFIQPTTDAAAAGWGVVMPKAHLKSPPEIDRAGDTIKLTVTYVPRPGNLNSATTIGIAQNEPWYLAVTDRSA